MARDRRRPSRRGLLLGLLASCVVLVAAVAGAVAARTEPSALVTLEQSPDAPPASTAPPRPATTRPSGAADPPGGDTPPPSTGSRHTTAAPSTAGRPPPSPGAGVPVRARRMTVDAEAPYETPAGVGRGHYVLSVTTTGGSGRIELTVEGSTVGAYTSAGPAEFSAPIHLRGPDEAVGVRLADGETIPVRIGHLELRPTAPGFTTRGTEVVDVSGRPVVLRGVNRTGLNLSARAERLDAADVEAMASWGVTTVRLKLGQHLWLPGYCEHDPGYRSAVDRAVDLMTRRGMFVVLDLAWTTAGDRCGAPGLQPMPDVDSVPFWQQVATRYGDEPLVAFNLFNEPGHVSRTMWRDGGTMTDGNGVLRGRTWTAVGMQRLYDVVRSTGATNLVFVSGIDFSADLRPAISHPLDGYGLVFGPHIYCHDCEHLPDSVARGIEPAVGRFPIVVTEFGSTIQRPTFNQRVVDWAEQRGIGWQAFMWLPVTHGEFGLLASWDTYEPSPGGRPVLAALRQAVRSG